MRRRHVVEGVPVTAVASRDTEAVDIHGSFSLWTPEIYVRGGGVHLYLSVWKTLLLVALIVRLVRRARSRGQELEPAASRSAIVTWGAFVIYLVAIVWPVGLIGFAAPWDAPPPHISYNGSDYGNGQGTPDPRVDTYGCNSEDAIRDGTFGPVGLDITRVEQVGHLSGIFGGPAIYFAHEASGGWLIVRPTADCWIPYPEWI
jgi:hypothetical protein